MNQNITETLINYQKLIKEYKSLVKLALVSGLSIGAIVATTVMMVIK